MIKVEKAEKEEEDLFDEFMETKKAMKPASKGPVKKEVKEANKGEVEAKKGGIEAKKEVKEANKGNKEAKKEDKEKEEVEVIPSREEIKESIKYVLKALEEDLDELFKIMEKHIVKATMESRFMKLAVKKVAFLMVKEKKATEENAVKLANTKLIEDLAKGLKYMQQGFLVEFTKEFVADKDVMETMVKIATGIKIAGPNFQPKRDAKAPKMEGGKDEKDGK